MSCGGEGYGQHVGSDKEKERVRIAGIGGMGVCVSPPALVSLIK